MVGAARFELATLCSQSRCATRLRYAPTPAIARLFAGLAGAVNGRVMNFEEYNGNKRRRESRVGPGVIAGSDSTVQAEVWSTRQSQQERRRLVLRAAARDGLELTEGSKLSL